MTKNLRLSLKIKTLVNSSEEDEDEVSSSLSDNEEKITCDEAEDNKESDNEPEPANNIPIVIGLRSPPLISPNLISKRGFK